MSTFSEIIAKLQTISEPTLAFIHKAPSGIAEEGKSLGIFSGSFNPPTIAHERLCQHAQGMLKLDEVLLLLAIVNVDKTLFGFELEERLKMMTAIAKERSNWSVAACSHGRFVEKAQAVAKAYPKGTGLQFIVGYDTLVRIFEHRFYTDIGMTSALQLLFERTKLAVMPRGEADEAKVKQFLENSEVVSFAHRIFVLPSDPSILWVSSTQVRQKLAQGEPIDDLVPPVVKEFLASGRLSTFSFRQRVSDC